MRLVAEGRTPGQKVRARRRYLRFLPWVAAPLLLWLALRSVPVIEILSVLGRLSLGQILILLGLNTIVVLTLSGRWWVILRTLDHPIHYLQLSAYRLAAFSVSYFTPGPQFGGEPLQAYLVWRRNRVPASTAAASVALDKAVELIGNSAVLSAGVFVAARMQVLEPPFSAVLAGVALSLLGITLSFLISAWLGWRPASRALQWAPAWLERRIAFQRVRSAVMDAESQIGAFCRDRPSGLIWALAFTVLSWLALLVEYWLALRFLEVQLSPLQTFVVITAARIAILMPFPGGLGVLEASQMLALQFFGYTLADGAGMGLLIRGRDLIFGAVGLWLGWRLARGRAEIATTVDTRQTTSRA